MNRRYATMSNPTIQAVAHELYRFSSEDEALHQLKMLKRHFIHSRRQLRNDAHPSVHLWIKGYAVMPEEKQGGIIGNYAIISYRQVEGRYVLYAIKLPVDAKLHPQRVQVRRDTPNWGHPVLRSIRAGATYATQAAAERDLALLQAHFPLVSILKPGKLHIMIYCADRPAKQRMVKHILEINMQPDCSYRIDSKERAARKKPKQQPLQRRKEAMPSPIGHFAAKVVLSRIRKEQ